MNTTLSAPHANTDRVDHTRGTGSIAWLFAAASAVAVAIANLHGVAMGDDGVGYWATADSLVAGRGLRYVLEDPLTVWPPGWPGLMALLDMISPLTTYGAAIVLNLVVAAAIPLAVHRLLRRLVSDRRLVLAGTAVSALGPSMIGLGHLLMTDQAFALVVVCWLSALIDWYDRDTPGGTIPWDRVLLVIGLMWCAVMLRYVGVVLMPIGALWLLADQRRPFTQRLPRAIGLVAAAALVPAIWVVRNLQADGTVFGPRYSSDRGLVGNTADLLSTLGQFLLPGVDDQMIRLWAGLGLAALAVAAAATVMVLARRRPGPLGIARAAGEAFGRPGGLPLAFAALYLGYMLVQRSGTALNRLDLRLLNPAYLPLLIATLILIDRLTRHPGVWSTRLPRLVSLWAAVTVAVGIGAVAMFANDDDFLLLNFQRPAFDSFRSNGALTTLPDGCRLYSNLPNAVYGNGLEARWSPRHTALESPDRFDDLTPLLPTLGRVPTCLVWFELDAKDPDRPTYGNLFRRDELAAVMQLDPIDRTVLPNGEAVATYRMLPLAR